MQPEDVPLGVSGGDGARQLVNVLLSERAVGAGSTDRAVIRAYVSALSNSKATAASSPTTQAS